MIEIKKEDLTLKELNSLCPTYGLFDGVNYEEVKYYKNDEGKLFELSICMDGSLSERIEQLKHIQRKKELLGSFGI